MKMAIASDDGKIVASHFGRTKGFVICAIEEGKEKSREYRVNTFTGHARGMEGAGHEHSDKHACILDALKDCKVVISHGMGQRLYIDLQNAGKEVFITDEVDVDNVVQSYIAGKLVDKPEMGCTHKHE